MVQCPERCKICAQPATLETVLPQKSEDPDVIRITGCACGAFTADRDWWYMEADSERTASPPERFARLSSALRTSHEADKPAHLGRKTWSDLGLADAADALAAAKAVEVAEDGEATVASE